MRTRLLLGSLVLAVVAIAAFFVPAAIAISHAERTAQLVELQQEAMDASASAGRRDLPGHQFAVYDRTGRRIEGSGPAALDGPLRPVLGGRSGSTRHGRMRVVAVPLAAGGALRAAEPAREADDRVRAALGRLLLVALALIAAGSGAAWLLARRLSRPLRDLGAGAARIGDGDFTVTVPMTGLGEIDEVASALNATAGRLGRLVERERRLTADASHQLRTPIAGLRLALEAELEAPRRDHQVVLREALGAVERLEDTVTALTALARDELPTTGVPLKEVAVDAVARWTSAFADERRSIIAEVPGATVALGRRRALDVVVDVLLDNALRHGRGPVVVSVNPGPGHALLRVTDEGTCEVPDARLFARRDSDDGGTGLGLALARTLAEAEGGRLRLAERTPTTFQLQLPIEPEATDRA